MSKTKKRRKQAFDMNNLENAVNKVQSGEMSIRKAASFYNIPKSTIGDRVSGKREVTRIGKGRKPSLPSELEKKIVESVKHSAKLGVGITRKQLLTRVGTLCKRIKLKTPFKNSVPGKEFWQQMKLRHPDLTIRKPEKLSSLRCRMMNPVIVNNYFKDLADIVASNNLTSRPSSIWNCDETGKTFEHDPVKVIAEKGCRSVPGKTSANRQHVTIMACVNASGSAMSPLLIVKGKTSKSLYGYNTTAAPPGTVWAYQESVWINDNIGEKFFREVFLPQCGDDRPQLLILDGHSSHETLALISCAIENNILLLSLPPHTTHQLQPLDKCVFGPFNRAFNTACAEFLQENSLHQVNNWTFPALFKTAWEASFTPSNIKSGFKSCGIYPLNPSVISVSAFQPSYATDVPQHPSAPSSVRIKPTATISSPTELVHHQSASSINTESTATISFPESEKPNNDENVLAVVLNTTTLESIPIRSTSREIISLFPSDPNQPSEIENPEYIMDLLLSNEAKLVEETVSETVTCSDWNSEIESLFLPPAPTPKHSKTTSNDKSLKKSKSHRLLTSTEIVEEKEKIAKNKEQKEKEKMERERKRKTKQNNCLREKKSLNILKIDN